MASIDRHVTIERMRRRLGEDFVRPALQRIACPNDVEQRCREPRCVARHHRRRVGGQKAEIGVRSRGDRDQQRAVDIRETGGGVPAAFADVFARRGETAAICGRRLSTSGRWPGASATMPFSPRLTAP